MTEFKPEVANWWPQVQSGLHLSRLAVRFNSKGV